MDGQAASTARSVPKEPATVKPFITILVLVTGVVGGLVLVISVILFCKYCIRRKKIFKRQPVLFGPHSPTKRRQYHAYESLDLTTVTDVSSGHRQSSPKPTISISTDGAPSKDVLDEENNIDYAVRKYKESLKADEATPHSSDAEASPTPLEDASLKLPEDPPPRRVSFLMLERRPSAPSNYHYQNTRRRFTDGDFPNLKALRSERAHRMVKQKTYSGPTLETVGRDQRRQSLGSLRRTLSEVHRGVKTNAALQPYLADTVTDFGSNSRIVSSKVKDSYGPCPSPNAKSYRTEVAAEVHRDPSSGSGSSKGDMSISSMTRTASPPKVLGMTSNSTSGARRGKGHELSKGKPKSARHSQSLEMVSPTDKLTVKHDHRRVKSYDGELLDRQDGDYDRLEITQFHRGPFYNTDYDVVCEGRSPELRSKVRYNDTGSFEDLNDEDVQLLEDMEAMDESDDTETLNGAQKYRELWNLRATFEEEEDFSDTIRMEDMTSPEDQSPGEHDPVMTSVTTSFDSNTDPEHQPHQGQVSMGEGTVKPGSANLLHPNYETRRETYRSILSKRLKRIEAPTSTDNSFDSVETLDTDGDVSDTSRPEQTTTSFESTTDNTDSTGERETHRLQQMRGDSGYKSLETQQTLTSQGQAQPAKKQIHFALDGDQETLFNLPEPSNSAGSSPRREAGSPGASPGGGEAANLSVPSQSPVATSPRRSATHFDRKSARSASKKRREYSRERQAVHVDESVGAEVETDSRSDQLSGDSFDEGPKAGKLSVFTRFFKSQSHKKGPMMRDYSIDEKTNAIFHEFVRHDPYLDTRSKSVGVVGGPPVARPSHPYTRHRSLHRKHTDPGTDPADRRRNKLTPDMRSVSLGSDSSTSSVRRLSPQDSIEEEDYTQLSPGIREQPHFHKLWAEPKVHSIHAPTHSHQGHRQNEAVLGGQNTIHEIPIIKLPEDEFTDA